MKYHETENRSKIFFGIWACLLPLNKSEILFFGGDVNYTRDEYPENLKQSDECQQLRVLNTDTMKVKIVRDRAEIPIKIVHKDFFYFNQTVKYQNKYYLLGKDHIHVTQTDLSRIDCMVGEGDYEAQ